MKKRVTYEHPIGDSTRYILRLEALFEMLQYQLKGPTIHDTRAAIETFLVILDILERVELVPHLQHDLQCHLVTLQKWHEYDSIDTEKLKQFMGSGVSLQQSLQQLTLADVIAELLDIPMFGVLKQRQGIAGGQFRADMPSYYHWLQQNPKQRYDELHDCLALLQPVQDVCGFNLYMLRQNALSSQQQCADAGFFQENLGAACQLIRVHLSQEQTCYPEISAGKQRFTVRFFQQDSYRTTPAVVADGVVFELSLCQLEKSDLSL